MAQAACVQHTPSSPVTLCIFSSTLFFWQCEDSWCEDCVGARAARRRATDERRDTTTDKIQ
eukprot:5373521-Prymnesium_polylepis.1